MKAEKIEDKLFDLYGIGRTTAQIQWKATSYQTVLKDKIEKAKKLQRELMEAPMLKRDMARIARIGKCLAHNYELLKEVE